MSILRANSWQSSNGIPYDKLIQHQTYAMDQLITTITNPGGNYVVTSLSVTITSKRANSNFFIMTDLRGYIDANSTNGWNTAITREISGNQVYVAGVTGSSGDSWMGFYHGSGLGANSYSKIRTAYDSPLVAKGTAIKYSLAVGGWTTNGGTFYVGYNGYGTINNRITVFEFAG